MPSPNKPEEITHELMRDLFDYDSSIGRLVRRKKPGKFGKGNIGEVLPATKSGNKYPTYMARVQGYLINYPRLVWLWHHESAPSAVRVKVGLPRDDFRIENLELYRGPLPRVAK